MWIFCLIGAFGVPFDRAESLEIAVGSNTVFQLQQYRDVERLEINKTRFTQYLSFNLYESSEKPVHSFHSRFRFDSELGYDASPDAPVDNLDYQHLEVLYAYYEARRLWDLIDFRLGRQVTQDAFGFYPLDGMWVRLSRQWYVGVEFYAGIEIKQEFSGRVKHLYFPNSDRYQSDGVDEDKYMTRTFGASLFLDGFEDYDLSLSYRLGESGATDEEKLGGLARAEFFDIWEVYGNANYDLYLESFESWQAGTRLDLGWGSAFIEHDFSRPNWDADSIFNFFRNYNRNAIALGVTARPDEFTFVQLDGARQLQADSRSYFDQWGEEGTASYFFGFDLRREMTPDWDLRGSYDMTMGWGGDEHRMSLGSGLFVLHRKLQIESDLFGSVFDKLIYNDILEEHENRGFAWGLSVLVDLQLHEDIRLWIRSELSSSPYIERSYAFFTGLDATPWFTPTRHR